MAEMEESAMEDENDVSSNVTSDVDTEAEPNPFIPMVFHIKSSAEIMLGGMTKNVYYSIFQNSSYSSFLLVERGITSPC